MSIYKKLLNVKKKVPYIQKDKQSFQYSYATPSAVLGTLNPLLNDEGLILKTEVLSAVSTRVLIKTKEDKVKTVRANKLEGIEGKKEFLDVYETLYDLDLRFTWVDIETGEKDENLFFASGMNGDEKGVGSALTYGERYFMLKYFNIPTDDDDPDAFQAKNMTEEDLKKEALKALENAKTADEVGGIWAKYTSLKKDEEFKSLVTKLGSKLKEKK